MNATTTPETLDLTPRGTTTIFLFGNAKPEDWRPGAGTYASECPAEHREALGLAIKEAEKIAKGLRSRKAAAEFLSRIGRQAFEAEDLESLRSSIQIRLIDIWFPPRFERLPRAK